VARVMQEQQLRAKSEEEIRARVQAEIKAREQAEMEAEARYRQEAAARARAAAEERRKREEESRATGTVARVRKPTNWPVAIGVGVVVLLAAAVGLLEVVPLGNYIGGAQETLSKRLGVPVTISGLRYSLLRQELTLERVGIGKLQEIKADTITVRALPTALLADSKRFDEVQLNSVSLDQDSLALIPAWIRAQPADQPLHVRRIRARAVKLAVRELDTQTFDADVLLAADGTLQRAQLSDAKLRAELVPKDKAVRVALEAREWRPPFGFPLEFSELALEAVFGPQQVTVSNIEGKIGFAPVKGSARASWDGNGIRVEGDFSITNGDLSAMLGGVTRNFSATGVLNANATYSLQAKSLPALFDQPRVEATFNIERGSLNNVDLVRAIQSPSRDGVRGGKTAFNTLTGSLVVAGGAYSYRQLQLTSGPMNASGAVDVAANGDLTGRVNAELGSKSVVVARGTLIVTGNVKTPSLRQ
jgi:hypothetical protein